MWNKILRRYSGCESRASMDGFLVKFPVSTKSIKKFGALVFAAA